MNRKNERKKNLTNIINLFRQRGPMTQSMVKDWISFQPSTVSYLINDLLKSELVVPTGKINHDGGPGKPGNLLTLNNAFAQFIGIYVEDPSIQLYHLGLDGTQLSFTEETINNPTEVEELLIRMVQQELAKHSEIKGIGIAIKGLVLEGDKIKFGLREGVHEQMEVIGLAKRLSSQFPEVPVVIENDAHCTAIHYQYTQQQEKLNLLLYMLNQQPFGIGCSILIKGQLYKGKNGAAGQFFYRNTRFADVADRERPNYLHTMVQELMPHILTSSYLLDPEKVVFTGSYLRDTSDEDLRELHSLIDAYAFPYEVEFARGEINLHPGKGAAFLSINNFIDEFIAKVGAR